MAQDDRITRHDMTYEEFEEAYKPIPKEFYRYCLSHYIDDTRGYCPISAFIEQFTNRRSCDVCVGHIVDVDNISCFNQYRLILDNSYKYPRFSAGKYAIQSYLAYKVLLDVDLRAWWKFIQSKTQD